MTPRECHSEGAWETREVHVTRLHPVPNPSSLRPPVISLPTTLTQTPNGRPPRPLSPSIRPCSQYSFPSPPVVLVCVYFFSQFMSSSVFYKFASQRTESRVTFDGTGISVFDLKKDIILANNLGKANDFDLFIYDSSNQGASRISATSDDDSLTPLAPLASVALSLFNFHELHCYRVQR